MRRIAKADLPLNDATPDIRIDPDSFAVYVDGELMTDQPAVELPAADGAALLPVLTWAA